MLIIIQYTLTILIWGSTWLAIKFQLDTVDPMVSIAYRFLLASLILFAFCRITKRHVRFSPKEHLLLMLQGMLSFSFAYWFIYCAELYLASGLVAVIGSCIIFFNILNGVFFLNSRVDMTVLVGALTGLLGIILIFWPEIASVNMSHDAVKGMLIGFMGAMVYSLGNILVERNHKKQLPLLQSNAFGMAYGAFFMILLSCILGKTFNFEFSVPYIASLFYLVVFGSVIAFYCYFSLIGKIGAGRAAYGSVVTPVIALFFSTFFEAYQWTSFAVAGIVLLITGNLIVLQKKTSNLLKGSFFSRPRKMTDRNQTKINE